MKAIHAQEVFIDEECAVATHLAPAWTLKAYFTPTLEEVEAGYGFKLWYTRKQ